ncbi:type II secretion system F family protein [Actimicrobium antarcticum]|uniref:Type II secretion system inner membrane protein GspF n=1 Tax=Actimicrobium antarcticum TaxID=1051899 RepID=A0ABP7TTB5_9BURK
MQFAVRALTSDQLVTQLTIDARDADEARRQVAARGLFVASVTPLRGARSVKPARLALVLFSQELLALLNAGLSIVEALEALLEKEGGGSTSAVLSRLLAGLRDGQRFSSVLAAQPELFPALYVGIIRAAEGTSDLPQSLTRFIDYQQRIDQVRSKIISAAIYPMILLVVGGAVSLFLIAYVVPRFAAVYEGTGRALPWLSQLMLDWGRFAAAHTATLLAGLALLLAMLIWLARRLAAGGGVAGVLARLPGVGERVRIYALSRLYLTLGMLLEGGIAIVPALQTVQGMVSPDIRAGLQQATLAIQSGMPMSLAFDTNHLTTPISLRMLRVGERTGDMGAMLTQSAAFYDGEISRWIDRFTRTFEPLLMAAIGLIVGGIVILLYMPIFDLAGSLS